MTNILSQDSRRAAGLLTPAYLWLSVAIFLPLAAMLYFSFLSDAPFGPEVDWRYTAENYLAFSERHLCLAALEVN